MRDILPAEAPLWRQVQATLLTVLDSYAYEEVQLPLLERTELFSRGVGEATDIVEKEMYSLEDRDGDSLTLRPEGTASCVRALQQHGLLYNQTQRVYYGGPMFRYERPQKGRYRQFQQIGAEVFGFAGPDVDAELLLMGQRFWDALGLRDQVRLELNTLGSGTARQAFRDALTAYLEPQRDALDADSRRRLATNPLRILDSKVPETQALLAGAPRLADYVDDDGRRHFEVLLALLDQLGIAYQVNERLVRGLDYYTHTVFEWVTDALGAQGAVCAGGRYDGLVERLGGRPTPAAGFAVGVDRVVLLAEQQEPELPAPADVYLCVADGDAVGPALALADRLRTALPGWRVRCHGGGGKLKNQLKRADASGARWALILGADELADGSVTLKPLRTQDEQQRLPVDDVLARLRSSS